jgi:hypothetical protein
MWGLQIPCCQGYDGISGFRNEPFDILRPSSTHLSSIFLRHPVLLMQFTLLGALSVTFNHYNLSFFLEIIYIYISSSIESAIVVVAVLCSTMYENLGS